MGHCGNTEGCIEAMGAVGRGEVEAERMDGTEVTVCGKRQCRSKWDDFGIFVRQSKLFTSPVACSLPFIGCHRLYLSRFSMTAIMLVHTAVLVLSELLLNLTWWSSLTVVSCWFDLRNPSIETFACG